MSFALTMIFALIFSSSFLDTRAHGPKLHKILLVLTGILAVAVPLQLVHVELAARLVMPVAIAGFIVKIIAGLIVWRQGTARLAILY